MHQNSQRPVVKVALYARSATDEANGSVEAQIDCLTSLVDDRRKQGENWVDEDTLVDRGRSGYDTCRPAYQELLRLIRSRQIDVVAVTKLDRISRNITEFVKFSGELGRHGVKLVSLAEQIDVAYPIGWLEIVPSRRTAQKRRLC